MLIEDEAIVRWATRRSLESLDADVTEADTVARAETLWQASLFDLVVTDQRLSDGLGSDLVDRMRRAGRDEPVIYLSAETEAVASIPPDAAGLNMILPKPLDYDALRKAAPLMAARRKKAAPPSAAGSEPAEQPAVISGRFRLLAAGAVLDSDAVRNLARDADGAAWVAVDLSAVTHSRTSVWPDFIAWAKDCRGNGGRLCLVGASPEWERELCFYSVHKDVDVVKDVSMLAALGRRPVSSCERAAVLNSVTPKGMP